MKNNIHLLERYRKASNLSRQDVATLLNIDASNLQRYEVEKRLPTPEILLTYHILFGASLTELLQPLSKKVKSNLIRRSERLLPLLIAKQTPKSKHTVSYLSKKVKYLKTKNEYDN